MSGRIFQYLKLIVLVLLLLEAVSPHHHHTSALCCFAGECENIPLNLDCETDHSGERVIICKGEKAVCPDFISLLPIFLIRMALFCLWRERSSLKSVSPKGKSYHLSYPREKFLYEFILVSYPFLRPPPAGVRGWL